MLWHIISFLIFRQFSGFCRSSFSPFFSHFGILSLLQAAGHPWSRQQWTFATAKGCAWQCHALPRPPQLSWPKRASWPQTKSFLTIKHNNDGSMMVCSIRWMVPCLVFRTGICIGMHKNKWVHCGIKSWGALLERLSAAESAAFEDLCAAERKEDQEPPVPWRRDDPNCPY